LPASMGGMIRAVRNLSSFRLRAHYTNGGAGAHSLSPDDFTTIYNVKPLYGKGFDGTGQSIAVIGQTEIHLSDLDSFRDAAGLPPRTSSNFQEIQVPNSGVPDVVPPKLTDADIGREWSQAVAPNATIIYVFVANDPAFNAFDALDYAIDNNVAPVISISNGACEETALR